MTDVCIKIFDSKDEAELFKFFLEDQGIDSYIMSHDCNEDDSEMTCCKKVKLVVDIKDKIEALKIIEESYDE